MKFDFYIILCLCYIIATLYVYYTYMSRKLHVKLSVIFYGKVLSAVKIQGKWVVNFHCLSWIFTEASMKWLSAVKIYGK